MKDTLNKIAYDSTTAIAAGTGVSHVSNSTIIMLLCTLFAPVVRDLLIKLIDHKFSKIRDEVKK